MSPSSQDSAPRRNEHGRTRNRGQRGPRQYSAAAPGQRKRSADPARLVAFKALREVSGSDAYANLVLPRLIRDHRLDKRDAAFATELAYGALRAQGFYDAVLAPWSTVNLANWTRRSWTPCVWVPTSCWRCGCRTMRRWMKPCPWPAPRSVPGLPG